ncbi:MAG: PLDc N-terminal domain-containing protein [Lachnospiraceae bacterium]|nr:PLDc N-terminal domain-containing protein [Lachnospiraceae bacterium]
MMEEQEGTIIHLIKNGKKGFFHALFSRFGIILILMLVQAFFLFGLLRWFADLLPHILGGSVFISILIVLYIINTDLDPTAKLTWLILIMPFPIFGGLLYLYTRSELGHRVLRKRTNDLNKMTQDEIKQSAEVMNHFMEEAPGPASLAKYIKSSGCFPVYENTRVTYFPLGENLFEEMIKQLEQAKEYIFMEYFIIDEGFMWGKILEVLERKAHEGVDVRVMYDGTCEFSTLPRDYPKRLRKVGIK